MKTTIAGSYPKIPNRPRPAKHRMAVARFQQGKITIEELKKIENDVTVEVIEELIGIDLDIITDGMIRWEDGQTPFANALEGFERKGLIRYFDTNTYYRQPVATGPIRFKHPITVDDFLFAKTHSKKPVKPVITGPYTLARLSENNTTASSRILFWMSLAPCTKKCSLWKKRVRKSFRLTNRLSCDFRMMRGCFQKPSAYCCKELKRLSYFRLSSAMQLLCGRLSRHCRSLGWDSISPRLRRR